MKINTDCLRDVMLQVESDQLFIVNDDGYVEKLSLGIHSLYDALPKYSHEDIFHCLYNLEQAGYVNLSVLWSNGRVYSCSINHITYSGHEFLNRIRDSKRWAAVKTGLSAVRDYSLSAISSVAEGVTTAAINAYLQNLQS